MIVQFEVAADGSKWEINSEELTWRQVAEGDDVPAGKLSMLSLDLFSLAPRTAATTGPGAGLSTVFLRTHIVEQVLFIYLRANVEVRNFTMSCPVNQIRYEILSSK